jgi:hypothetical protein
LLFQSPLDNALKTRSTDECWEHAMVPALLWSRELELRRSRHFKLQMAKESRSTVGRYFSMCITHSSGTSISNRVTLLQVRAIFVALFITRAGRLADIVSRQRKSFGTKLTIFFLVRPFYTNISHKTCTVPTVLISIVVRQSSVLSTVRWRPNYMWFAPCRLSFCCATGQIRI